MSDNDMTDISTNETTNEMKKNDKSKKRKKKDGNLSDDGPSKAMISEYQKIIKDLNLVINTQNITIEKLKTDVQMLMESQACGYIPEEDMSTDNEEFDDTDNNKSKGANANKKKEDYPDLPEGSRNVNSEPRSAAVPYKEKMIMKQLPPPITTYNVDIKKVIELIRLAINNNNFNINAINKNIVKILPQKSGDHEKIVKYLKDHNIKFFTYTPKDKKPYSLIIKKLPLCFEIEDVEEAIKSLNLDIVIIKIFKTNYNWIVQLKQESDVKSFKSIKYLLHCKVQLENVKKSRIMQCKNCQRYNHTAVNCNMPYRCVKCCNDHEPGKCEIPKKEENKDIIVITDQKTGEKKNIIGVPVECVNCGKKGHTANANICEVRKKLLEKLNNSRKTTIIPSPIINPKNTKVSYASLLQPNRNNTNIDFFEVLNNECSNIFGKNLLTCIAKVGEFKKTFEALRTNEEKAKALLNLFVTLQLDE